MLKIEHADGTYALYLHLASFTRISGWVNQGDAIAVSGNSGNSIYHLHVAVLSKEGVELPMIFDEAGGRELNYRDTLTSSQGGVPIVFKNGASSLWQDQSWGRANLKICADNLAGQMVYVRFFQRGKSLDYGQRAYSTCVTFWDMDGAGTLSPSTTWYTQAALNQKPNPYWSFPCAWPTGGQGLCDSLRRP
jgi:murein DD-endopeptidase MepM/ murein hydrolase activator NlpD